MEWYIMLSLIATAISILYALLRCCLCSLGFCAGDEENAVQLTEWHSSVTPVQNNGGNMKTHPSSISSQPQPFLYPYHSEQFKDINLNAKEKYLSAWDECWSVQSTAGRNNRDGSDMSNLSRKEKPTPYTLNQTFAPKDNKGLQRKN